MVATWRIGGAARRYILFAAIPWMLVGPPAESQPQKGPTVTIFGGQMTDNQWEQTLDPSSVVFLDSHLIGLGIGYEWPTRVGRLGLGVEGQIVKHFGRQDNLEFNLPVVARYYPREPFVSVLDSFAFGIGISIAAKRPQTEIDRDGETSKALVYWMGELAFQSRRSDSTYVLRLHHRSDAYGLFETDSGSNALVFGYRRRF